MSAPIISIIVCIAVIAITVTVIAIIIKCLMKWGKR